MVQTREERVPSAELLPPPRHRLARRRVLVAVGVVAVLLAAVLLLRLGAQERGGPAHTSISLPNGAPAMLYIPGHVNVDEFPLQPPPDRRPPLVVVAHGYSSDQAIMSSIARSLARAGYAALTFDFRGHGANTKAFKGDLGDDLDAALDWADRSPYVDPNRIALLGQSMGAGAVLEFASRDPRPKAVIPLSGGWVIDDARVPPNVLFIAAAGDPKRIEGKHRLMQRRCYLVRNLVWRFDAFYSSCRRALTEP